MGKKKFISLSFLDEESFGRCLDILCEEEIPFELPGDTDIIISISLLETVKQKLKEAGIKNFTEVEVISASDLPPAEIAALRRGETLP